MAVTKKQRGGLAGSLLALGLAIWAMPVPALAQRDDPDAIFQRIHDFMTAGDDEAAIVEAQRFEAVIKARYGTNHPNYEAALNVMGVTYEKAGRYREAEELHTRVLTLREKRKKPSSREIAETLGNLGVVSWKQGWRRFLEARQVRQGRRTLQAGAGNS
ncbi:MAG: tetratricopeptide repeat protein [Steroidobacteraceae bacterium]